MKPFSPIQRRRMWLAGLLLAGLVVVNVLIALAMALFRYDPAAYMNDGMAAIYASIHIVAVGLILIFLARGLRYDDQPRDIGRLVILTGVVAIVSSLMILWWHEAIYNISPRTRDWVFGTMFTSTLVTLVLVQNALMGAVSCPIPLLRWMRASAVVLAWILAVTLIAIGWFIHAIMFLLPGPMHEVFFGSLVALAVATVLTTGLVPLVSRIQRRRLERQTSFGGRIWSLEMACPRCTTMLTLTRGMNRCPVCALGLRVSIEEPRCACGYLLFSLTGDHCPECGADVPDTARWRPTTSAAAVSDHSAIAADGQ
ncbi:MAG: hypothetical protein KC983_02085 [Phycisphaerales bacterium]|nr:hypothetical protein [Phycisphaerales bacterium]